MRNQNITTITVDTLRLVQCVLLHVIQCQDHNCFEWRCYCLLIQLPLLLTMTDEVMNFSCLLLTLWDMLFLMYEFSLCLFLSICLMPSAGLSLSVCLSAVPLSFSFSLCSPLVAYFVSVNSYFISLHFAWKCVSHFSFQMLVPNTDDPATKMFRRKGQKKPSLSKTPPSKKINEFKLVVFILTLLTLLHLNYWLLHYLRYYLSDEFAKSFRWYRFPMACQSSPSMSKDMVNLASSIGDAFSELNLSAAVCYGTLWGALRQNSMLRWDDNVDFCILNSELKKVSFDRLYWTFRQRDVDLSPFNWNTGSYSLTKGQARGEINVFYDCSTFVYLTHSELENNVPDYIPDSSPVRERPKWACPLGWEPTVARLVHDLNRPFPLWLLEPPFSVHDLDGVQVSVPRDGVEIQKYLYPDDWWLEAKPPGC